LTLSHTLEGWVPKTPPFYSRPVLFESASSLCGTLIVGDGGLLVWREGNRIRCAEVDPLLWLIDDSVASEDAATIVDVGTTAAGVACFTDGTNVFATVVSNRSGACYFELYRATDPTSPATGAWVLHATIATYPLGGLVFGTSTVPGIPVRLASGRWVVAAFITHTGIGTQQALGVWYSDDTGLTWALGGGLWGSSTNNSGTSGVYLSDAGVDFAVDPNNGRLHLWTSSTSGASGGRRIFWSTTGTDWGTVRLGGALEAGNHWEAAVLPATETDLYGLDTTGRVWQRTGDGTTSFEDWTNTGHRWAPAGTTGRPRAVVANAYDRVFFFTGDRCMAAAGGWLIGAVGFA